METCKANPRCIGKIDKKPRGEDLSLVVDDFDDKNQQYYQQQEAYLDQNAKGMHVKLTLTFTGGGQMFNPYFTEVLIAGLCMERNRDPSCEKVGYVIFLRNTRSEESVHLHNHEFIIRRHNKKE
eukprot:9122229-Ditylum_brightwellii.AAC.1